MGNTSAKNKIIILTISWLVLSAIMFFYFFGFLDSSNQKTIDDLDKQNKDLAVLLAQKQNYSQDKTDLDKLSKQPIQSSDFFSKDITFVNELRVLENLSAKSGVKMQLSGISGVVGAEPKADTKTSIVQISYSMGLYGTYATVTDFIETLQNLSFIVDINSLAASVADKGHVNISLSGHLYIQN